MTTAAQPEGHTQQGGRHRHTGEHPEPQPAPGAPADAQPTGAQPTAGELMVETEDTSSGKVFAPSATPAAAWFGVILGLALLALCAVAIRDLIVAAGWISGDSWTRTAADWVADISWYDWMWPAAVGLIIAGLLLLYVAVKLRRRTYVNVGPYGVMWTRRGDVARRCSAAVAAIPGVEHATTVVGRRKATVTVTTGDTPVDRAEIKQVAENAVDVLAKRPRVKVRVVSRRRPAGGKR